MPTVAQLQSWVDSVRNLRNGQLFSTVDVIIYGTGNYIVDIGTAPSNSYNAKIGKMLSKYTDATKIKRNIVYDHLGNKSTTMLWR